ncbi:hypothetical protein EV356DRAFT_514550 [Viridothelium virens]|uniref:Uncharacterized protein n=1 Tax=Viridothelium virens TaxID=1048519 RepID=A0A6A6HCH5_VIRVR|nr:hypothetical protein EV356DRAFT_514550 [Viridothelium virens]
MAIDPLSAIGLGANILQFIEFISKLISIGNEIHSSVYGTTVENFDLEVITRTVSGLHQRIYESNEEWKVTTKGRVSNTDREIERLASSCDEIAEDLLSVLAELRAPGKLSKWNSMADALKTVWARSKIKALRDRLDQYKAGLHSSLMISLMDKVTNLTPTLTRQLASGSQLDRIKGELLQAIWEANASRGVSEAVAPIDLRPISSHLSQLTRHEQVSHLQSQILEQLSFQDQHDREFRIASAHAQTFKWIFHQTHDQSETMPWSNFRSWLEDNNEHLYWITGKAGSGKSTLMKFIVHEHQCEELLRNWAGDMPLIMTRFYFWNSGTVAQMSQEGLLRTILYDALSQKPELIAKIMPNRWIRSQMFGCDLHPWSLSELAQAFRRLLAQSESYKLCFFVDGLDEFDGDHEELIGLFKNAVSYQNVKACSSSRPWVIFEEAFFQRPSLMLEKLTCSDIVQYITANFDDNSGFRALQRREPDFASTLINNIAIKACGVFLWVTLVVQSLLSGMSNYDCISDLQKRLDRLPGDLEKFYRKIFNSIEHEYVEHACQYFRLVAAANGNLTVLQLSFADEDDLSKLIHERPVELLNDEEADYRFESTKRRLNSRCKGFLEIPTRPLGVRDSVLLSTSKTFSDDRHLRYLQRVAYLHRTVKDFLKTAEVDERIKASTKNFKPCVPLLNSSVLMLKTTMDPAHCRHIMIYAEQADTIGYHYIKILDEVHKSLDAHPYPPNLHKGSLFHTINKDIPPEAGFLEFVTYYNVSSYVSAKILQNVPLFANPAIGPLLDRLIVDYRELKALRDPELRSGPLPPPSLTLVRHLLNGGGDPNFIVAGRTTWQAVLEESVFVSNVVNLWTTCGRAKYIVPTLEHWASIVEIFILSGADPQANRNSPQASRIREAFGTRMPHRAMGLEKLLAERMKRRSTAARIVPLLSHIAVPDFHDIRPMPVMNRQSRAETARATLSETFRLTAHSENDFSTKPTGKRCRPKYSLDPAHRYYQ